ncbi:14419_t:CDS:1 [Dentiscutata heterogama]|uniref:14419_t:CDS:1 n=1 Tax=Dentiscutata heterogama TaxID=1316150 RepID=A0ACA9MJ60_9GLOM|nr:14419_t:CDS:1 [Dentiscutata heterogama]
MPECPNFELNCMIVEPPPLIQLPFPPTITALEIVKKRPHSKIRSKSPNAFFIYRKACFDQLARLNQRYQMTFVSKLVSKYWKNEPEQVKTEYKRIADEVEVKLNEERIKDLVYSDASTKQKRNPPKGKRIRKKCNRNNNNGEESSNRDGQQNNLQFMESQIHIDHDHDHNQSMEYFGEQYFYDNQLMSILYGNDAIYDSMN